jgi:hypothetical protein
MFSTGRGDTAHCFLGLCAPRRLKQRYVAPTLKEVTIVASVNIVRKKGGEAKKNKKGQYVFTKEGVYFALSKEQMAELSVLMSGLIAGTLETVEPGTDGVFVED